MPFNKKYKKALTFSFDDGVEDDIRLIEIMNKYGLKGTFNLNSGKLSDLFPWRYHDVKDVHRINYCDQKDLYNGHEVASHTVLHSCLPQQPYNVIYNELLLDKIFLEALYKAPVRGSALPFGSFSDEVIRALNELGFVYTRTVRDTFDFRLPTELPLLDPTCHFMDERAMELADKFLEDSEEDKLFYIWGHSYELVTEEDWDNFEKLCVKLSGREDVYYCTNMEAIENHE